MRSPPASLGARIVEELEAETYEERLRVEIADYASDCVDGGLTFRQIAGLLRQVGHDLNASDIRAMCVAQWLEDASEAPLN